MHWPPETRLCVSLFLSLSIYCTQNDLLIHFFFIWRKFHCFGTYFTGEGAGRMHWPPKPRLCVCLFVCVFVWPRNIHVCTYLTTRNIHVCTYLTTRSIRLCTYFTGEGAGRMPWPRMSQIWTSLASLVHKRASTLNTVLML